MFYSTFVHLSLVILIKIRELFVFMYQTNQFVYKQPISNIHLHFIYFLVYGARLQSFWNYLVGNLYLCHDDNKSLNIFIQTKNDQSLTIYVIFKNLNNKYWWGAIHDQGTTFGTQDFKTFFLRSRCLSWFSIIWSINFK